MCWDCLSIGTTESIKNINLNDIAALLQQLFWSDDGRVVVVGDIKESEILPKLSFLNKLPKNAFDLPAVPPAPVVEKTKIYYG